MKLCFICEEKYAEQDSICCEDCRKYYDSPEFYSLLNEVIHGRMTAENALSTLRTYAKISKRN